MDNSQYHSECGCYTVSVLTLIKDQFTLSLVRWPAKLENLCIRPFGLKSICQLFQPTQSVHQNSLPRVCGRGDGSECFFESHCFQSTVVCHHLWFYNHIFLFSRERRKSTFLSPVVVGKSCSSTRGKGDSNRCGCVLLPKEKTPDAK